MFKLFFLVTSFLILNSTVSGQVEKIQFYKDFDLDKQIGLISIPRDSLKKNDRYIQVKPHSDIVTIIEIFDSRNYKQRKIKNVKLKKIDNFFVIEFPKTKKYLYENNFLGKRSIKERQKWIIKKDSIFIIKSSLSNRSVAFSVLSFPSKDVLVFKSYSICCPDIDVIQFSEKEGVSHLMQIVKSDNTIPYSVNEINITNFLWLTCDTNMRYPAIGCDNGATVTKVIERSGNSLFWFIYYYNAY